VVDFAVSQLCYADLHSEPFSKFASACKVMNTYVSAVSNGILNSLRQSNQIGTESLLSSWAIGLNQAFAGTGATSDRV